jgi:signal peptidase I
MALSPAAFVFLLLLLVSINGSGQSLLSGKLRQKENREILPSVTITNMTQRKINISDMGGNYRIAARPGDTITFSSAGYRTDTLAVDNRMLDDKDGYQVYLEPRSVVLPTVRVDQNNYQLDSIKRREDYKWLYPVHRRKLIGSEAPTDGVGISVSPIDYFSAKETQRRRLRRRLAAAEKEYYIDARFPAAYVARITGLKGDSLQVFLVSYRPTYTFCRQASNEDIFLYINDQVRIYRKQH